VFTHLMVSPHTTLFKTLGTKPSVGVLWLFMMRMVALAELKPSNVIKQTRV